MDDPCVRRYTELYLPQVGASKFVIVPTKREKITKDPSRELTEEDLQMLQKVEACVRDAKEVLRQATVLTADRRDDITRTIKQAEAVQKRERIHISMRNTPRDLKCQARTQKRPCNVQVIPTSSHSHMRYIAGPTAGGPSPLNVNEDGISKLRAASCTVARAGRAATLLRHANAIRAGINSLELSLNVAWDDRGELLLEVIEREYDSAMQRLVPDEAQLQSIVQQKLLVPLSTVLLDPNDKFCRALEYLIRGNKEREKEKGWQKEHKSPNRSEHLPS
ncbi:hypothetical protein K461DRAFT_291128 [Myriangium duriaei CBS 260.36]|uniref:Uncharacterized protein n=1 Tax=Myriangium duriaei CBS 260.36 TaxID=1168546 RepID=A0A9P4JBY2_9PEZI|nr:hypothetical protein K461DRAFT_291128 [Myriangium duriaei CBS 260.36]